MNVFDIITISYLFHSNQLYIKATNRATLLELPGFVFWSDAATLGFRG